MLDQSFSASNFKKILEIENRKGNYLEGDFFADVVEITNKLKDLNYQLRLLKKKGLSKDDFILEKEIINQEKTKLIENKEELLNEKLSTISSIVTSSDFSLEIDIDTSISNKPVYRTTYTLENILTQKQLQYNFRKLYKVKQSSRYSIVNQLKCLLNDGFPKIILKTDIKDFYESIPQDTLLKKVNDENLLTYLSRKFIQQILIGYNKHTGNNKGVPRGIGISAYLVELFMRDIDSKIKALSNVMYYARYVDDIIVIFLPSHDNTLRDYKSEIKKILTDEGLTMNEDAIKTKIVDLSDKSTETNYSFDYLGYRFISGYDKSKKHIPLVVTISEKKKKKYANKLLKAFNLYSKQSKRNEKQARKIFVKRIKFLTSNTRLVNNKRNVLTGIYYTNSLINSMSDFEVLDRYFNMLVRKSAFPSQLKSRIVLNNSFVSGFNPSNIREFKANELNEIMQNWKV